MKLARLHIFLFIALLIQAPVTAVANPELAESCGIDMVLIMDSSSSIDETELATMRTAFKGFVDAFIPNTPTQIAVVEFQNVANITQNYTGNPTLVKNAIDNTVIGQFTNWQDALVKAHSMYDNRDTKPDLYVFASDGAPNRIGNDVRVQRPAALAAAVVEADAIKADGVRIVTLAIGDDIEISNLEAISSPDAVITSDFDELASDLAVLSDELCGGTLTVRKYVEGVPAAGWNFTINLTNGSSSLETTDDQGFAIVEIPVEGELLTTVVLKEILQQGFTLNDAFCSEENGVFDGVDTITDLMIGKSDVVLCEFYNVLNYCGDGVLNQESEQCDGTDGLGEHEACTGNCQKIQLSYCGDGIQQSPNTEALGGPLNDGFEECDGEDGVGEHQTCDETCTLVAVPYCGDGIMNQEEACDGTDGVGEDEVCIACEIVDTSDCRDGTVQAHEACDVGDALVTLTNASGNTTVGTLTTVDRVWTGVLTIGTQEWTLTFNALTNTINATNGSLVSASILTQLPDGSYTGTLNTGEDMLVTVELTQLLNGATDCTDVGRFVGGSLSCNPLTCFYNTNYCVPDVDTYCGDDIQQEPNDAGTGGPLNDGYEACDGSAPVGSTCTETCTLVEQTCEEAVAAGLLRGEIENDRVTVTNDGAHTYTVSLTAYSMYSLLTEDQTLFDAHTGDVAAGTQRTFLVTPPACAHQEILICGEPFPFAPFYGDRAIDTVYGEGPFCEFEPLDTEATVNVSVLENYPMGSSYHFLCDVAGFAATNYYWYFGDGDIIANSTNNSVAHTYAANGAYTVACTATDGENWQIGTLGITVDANTPPSAAVTVAQLPGENNFAFTCDVAGFTPTSYDWDFGDGMTLTGLNVNDVQHTFTQLGDFEVSCTASADAVVVNGSSNVSVQTCVDYTVSILSVSPNPALPGAEITVGGTVEQTGAPEVDLSGKTLSVNGESVAVLLNTWVTTLTAPDALGAFNILASFTNFCNETFTSSSTVTVSDGSSPESTTNQQVTSGGASGGCSPGYHQTSDGSCTANQPAPSLDLANTDTVLSDDEKELVSSSVKDILEQVEEGEDPSNAITGAVTGAGGSVFIWPLLLLILLILISFGIYFGTKGK
ncbi:MAG: PKD domain-containing protein [Candidatus Woesearchaeota archaeon]|nr:PKD domain-containing protein [Candidatus Woesearchaeota archaeon]